MLQRLVPCDSLPVCFVFTSGSEPHLEPWVRILDSKTPGASTARPA